MTEKQKEKLRIEISTRLWYALGDVNPNEEKLNRAVESIFDLIAKIKNNEFLKTNICTVCKK